jgi:hypothetical protein
VGRLYVRFALGTPLVITMPDGRRQEFAIAAQDNVLVWNGVSQKLEKIMINLTMPPRPENSRDSERALRYVRIDYPNQDGKPVLETMTARAKEPTRVTPALDPTTGGVLKILLGQMLGGV